MISGIQIGIGPKVHSLLYHFLELALKWTIKSSMSKTGTVQGIRIGIGIGRTLKNSSLGLSSYHGSDFNYLSFNYLVSLSVQSSFSTRISGGRMLRR